MKVSSSSRRSSKSRSKKSIEFSSKNQSEIVKISGLRPDFAKNASIHAMGALPDVPGAPPSEPGTPQGHPGRALGAPQDVPRASGSAPEASPERPGSAPNRPESPPKGPRAIFHRFFIDLRSIFDGFWGRLSMDFALISRSLCRRLQRRHKCRISKRRRVILGACLCSCVVQSLRIARASFELMFEHCMFSFVSLQPVGRTFRARRLNVEERCEPVLVSTLRAAPGVPPDHLCYSMC